MGEYLVSVVIPTIGRDHLRTAVASVQCQSVPTECLVVSDRPEMNDRIRDILRGLSFQLLSTAGRVGGSQARNHGLAVARGTHVAYLDDDDCWDPQKLELQLKSLESSSHPESTVSLTATTFEAPNGSIRILPSEPFNALSHSVGQYLVTRLDLRYGRTFMQTSSILGCRRLMQSFQWDASLPKHQDWDLFVRLFSTTGVHCVMLPVPLVAVYQASEGSVSKSPNWKASERWLEKHLNAVHGRARSDFAWSLIMRGALHERSLRGIWHALRWTGLNPPHLAAILVGFAGVIKR